MSSLFRENVLIALDSIKTQLLRTILTIVIIGIGIWSLVGILSAVKALENTISSDFASMGSNTFSIKRYEFTVNRNGAEREKINPVINYNDVRAFTDLYSFPYTKTSVSFIGSRGAEVKFENKKTDPEVRIYGVNENYLENTGTEVASGRNLNVFDIENNNKVCLVGADFLKNLFINDDPVNKVISIRGVRGFGVQRSDLRK